MGEGGDLPRVGIFKVIRKVPQGGYIAFTMVLVITGVIFLVAVTLTLLSVFQIQQSLSQELGASSYSLVEGCAEDALLESFENDAYAGGSRSYPEGSCNVSVSKAGNNWVLDVAATTATLYDKHLRVSILRGGTIQVLSWKQVE